MAARPNHRKEGPAGQGSRSVSLEDVALIQKVRNGQTEAYGRLVQKYQDRVFNTCWRICGHLEDARDLTQETFLKAFVHLAEFRRESAFYTWLFRVAVNLALSHRRDARRKRTVPLDDVPDGADTQAAALLRQMHGAGEANPAEAASAAELHGCVARALHALDDDHRAIVVLRDMEGLDYREISEILGIPSGTVKSRLHRARASICKALQPASSGRG